jgi:hypothetical protein
MVRTLVVASALASILLLAGGTRPAHAQFPFISAYPSCSPDSSYVVWSVFDPEHSHPEWVGFDVMRRVLPGCDELVRANAEIIPRLPDAGYSIGFGEPSGGMTIEYRVVPVDASRQAVPLGAGFCSPCVAYANCPPFSSPITEGTLQELAPGFVHVIACPGSCYPSPYFEGGVPADLAPHVGTGTAIRIFAPIGCGSVEGCFIYGVDVDHWEIGTCVTPTAARTWGQLKTIYR